MRAQMVQDFAARCAGRIVLVLREDRGIVLDRAGEERIHGVLEDELGRVIAPEGEAARIVREAWDAGLAPDPE